MVTVRASTERCVNEQLASDALSVQVRHALTTIAQSHRRTAAFIRNRNETCMFRPLLPGLMDRCYPPCLLEGRGEVGQKL